MAMSVVRRIRHRKQKDFKSTDKKGTISHHLDTFDINMNQGSWTLMSRTNSFARDVAADLRDQGLFYEQKL